MSAERTSSRLAEERELRGLVRSAASLPTGAEVGEIRADGSSWWIRLPARPSA